MISIVNHKDVPYFENSMNYMYQIIDPDAKETHGEWEEINKDAVTGNLKEKEIRQFTIGSNIIDICESFRTLEETTLDNGQKAMKITDSILEDTRSWFMRDIMVLTNITKSRSGFMLKKITEQVQKVITQDSKGKKNIGE